MGKVKKIAVGTVLVAAAGYVAGVLTAPKSGKETRKDIKDKTTKTISEAEKELKKLHTQLSQIITRAKATADKLSGKAKKDLDGAVTKAAAAKEKTRQLLSALHEGDAEDKDLQKAISEADKAVMHLKSFLKDAK
ncbi:MAG TPA: YtxH domain-containing protein [Candidatus Saccharimonadales bacterium]|nr:YtxH domain-containing protein [Candidatus Saccharimonadales bacterium]